MAGLKESTQGQSIHGVTPVTTEPTQLTDEKCGTLVKGVLLKAASDNAADVYVGGKVVTADTAETTGGYPLAPGESLFISVEDLRDVYVVSTATGGFVHWIAR